MDEEIEERIYEINQRIDQLKMAAMKPDPNQDLTPMLGYIIDEDIPYLISEVIRLSEYKGLLDKFMSKINRAVDALKGES